MELLLSRHTFTDNSTIGTIAIVEEGGLNNLCKILEDPDRELENFPTRKIYGRTAIPRGHYQIVVTRSDRFKRDLPLLVDVPGFEGVRIHAGNAPGDTEGCLLPGLTASRDYVNQSRLAFDVLFSTIQLGLKRGQVWITVQ